MSRKRQIRFRSWLALGTALAVMLALAGGAWAAFAGLPLSGQQVNDDPPTIDPTQNVNVSDLTAGSLAGAARVPWAAFAQAQSGSSAVNIVVRAFKAGAWQTEGFPESLNVDAGAAAPSIDFTGANRTVPWVAWAEPKTALGGVEPDLRQPLRASQPTPAQNGGQWIHEGQTSTRRTARRSTSTPTVTPTDPSLIGGTTTAGANPAPWITWQEVDNGTRPSAGPGQANVRATRASRSSSRTRCPATSGGACPAGTKPAGGGARRASATSASSRSGIDSRHRPGRGPARPVAERRPDARRDPGRHRVHRRQRHRAMGRLVRELRQRQHDRSPDCSTPTWCSPRARSRSER